MSLHLNRLAVHRSKNLIEPTAPNSRAEIEGGFDEDPTKGINSKALGNFLNVSREALIN